MKNNVLKKLMVLGIGSMLLMGSSVSVNASEHEHIGGTATCVSQAICEICKKPYGEVDSTNHINTELRTVKSASCTEDGYTGDTQCTDCGTMQGGTVIPATGHNDTDNDHYCDNSVPDRHGFGICNEKISECSGGTATCVSQAICDICKNPYGDVDLTNHAGGTELRNVKGDTCTEDGYTGDRVCADCGTKIKTGTVIPATGHIDENKDHYCDREDCKAKLSECSGGIATCVSQAVCDICGELYGEEDSDNHVGKMVTLNNKEATCEEDGYSGDTYCESCNNVVETGSELPRLGHIDEDTNHICDRETCGKVLSECTGGEATCKNLAVCEYCGREYGEKDMNNHVGDTEIRDDKPSTCTEDGYTGDTYCTSCNTKLLDGEPIAKLGHIDENKDHYCDREDCKAKLSECTGGVATCKDQAICEYCNNAYGELNAANHVGDTEIRDAKPATCCEDGYTGDTYCTSCNTKLLDGTIIPATGHVDNDDNNECDTCGIIINEPETEPITEKEKPAKKKETEKQTESKPVVEETESNLPEAPKTGDNTPVIALFSLLLGSIAIIFTCGTYRSRKED